MPEYTRLIHNYLRHDKKFPHVWCPGCGNGILLGSLIRAIDKTGLTKDEIVLVSGIGCSGRLPVYVDFNTLHTTHGRALTYATGVKLANPSLNVITIMGDGDSMAIGGNHFIHAARRNIDVTVVLINNWIYGMTGGQVSPTTPKGSYATTMPYGNYEPQFDIARVAMAAGATYVARGTAYHAMELKKLIMDGIKHKGFSLIEVLSPCTIVYGRKNRMSVEDMYFWFKENTVPISAWEKLPEEKRAGKIPRGVLHHDDSRPEYTEIYWSKVKELSGGEK